MKIYKKKNPVTNTSSYYTPIGEGIFENYDLTEFKAIGVFKLVSILNGKFIPNEGFTCVPLEDWEIYFKLTPKEELDLILEGAKEICGKCGKKKTKKNINGAYKTK